VVQLNSRRLHTSNTQSGEPQEAHFSNTKKKKKAGLEFEGHVPDAIRAAEAVAAGQRTFEHLIGIFEASSPDEDSYLSRKYGAGKDPSVNKSLGMFLDSTTPREDTIIRSSCEILSGAALFWGVAGGSSTRSRLHGDPTSPLRLTAG
jgi:hypothetical protein